ncbi:hypothetical protein VV869_00140 [Photobacterium sp. MCCC 1A19761]|uniref:hypothetical protein n=1 Tax=Photobacterium sp. MCCC 1A19761 TaxID=3115000 RepID=UPI00307E84ED
MELIDNKSNHLSLIVGQFGFKFVPVFAEIISSKYGYHTYDKPVVGTEFVAWDMIKGKSMISICHNGGRPLQIDSLCSTGDMLLKKLQEQLPTIVKDAKYDEFRTE